MIQPVLEYHVNLAGSLCPREWLETHFLPPDSFVRSLTVVLTVALGKQFCSQTRCH